MAVKRAETRITNLRAKFKRDQGHRDGHVRFNNIGVIANEHRISCN